MKFIISILIILMSPYIYSQNCGGCPCDINDSPGNSGGTIEIIVYDNNGNQFDTINCDQSGNGVNVECDLSSYPNGYFYSLNYNGNECFYDSDGVNDNSLPIELKSFNIINKNNINIIKWTTSSERNNDYFTIQRSFNGDYWKNIAKISGSGNSTKELNYYYKDYTYSNRINYYRLKQTDYNGNFEIFVIKSIDNKNNNGRKLIKTINLLNQEVDKNYKGIVIDIYDNGDKIKRYNKK